MTHVLRDPYHSSDEVEDAVLDLMYAFDVRDPNEDDGIVLLAEHLLVREIDFLYDRVVVMTPPEKTAFRQYLNHVATWRSRWGGVMSSNAPVAHALTLAAVAVPLLKKYSGYGVSAKMITDLVSEAMVHLPSCAQRYMPNDEISERDLPLIRGEMMTTLILRELGLESGAGVYSNEFFAWLGSHEEDVLRMYGEIKLRRTFDPVLIRDLLGGGRVSGAIAEGVL